MIEFGLGIFNLNRRNYTGEPGNNPTPAPTPAPAATAYLPAVGAQPLAAHGVQRIVAGYDGPLFELRRTSDGAMLEISAAPNSDLPDYAALDAWLAGSKAAVAVLFDQTGNGHHAVQSSSSSGGYQPLMPDYRERDGIRPMSFAGNRGLILPAGITANARDLTAFAVQRRQSKGSTSGTHQASWMLGAAWNTAGSLSKVSLPDRGVRTLTSSSFRSEGFHGRCQPEVTGYISRSSELVYILDGETKVASANNAGTVVGGSIGRGGQNYTWDGDTFAFVFYDSDIGDADAASVSSILQSAFSITGSQDKSLPMVLATGNSIVLGTGATGGNNNLWYTEPLLNSPCHLINSGVFGQNASTVYSHRARYIARYDANRPHNIIVAPEPTNDINSGAVGADSWNMRVKPFIDEAVAAGWTVMVPTIIKRAGFNAAKNAEKDAFNALARAYANGSTICLVDYALDDASLNLPDGTHPDSASYEIMAARQAAVINSIIAGA